MVSTQACSFTFAPCCTIPDLVLAVSFQKPMERAAPLELGRYF